MLQKFIELMEQFLSRDIDPDEFVTGYLRLRNEVLKVAYSEPRYKKAKERLVAKRKAGLISMDTYAREVRRLVNDFWPEQFRDVQSFTPIGNMLLDDLNTIIDAFDAPYGDLAIDEEELRQRIINILRLILAEKGKDA